MAQEPAHRQDTHPGQDARRERHDLRERERQERHVQRNLERQERRAQRKREAILTAAAEVFAQKGFASATTKDIANTADIGESTLYDYFDSKRDMLLAIFEQNHVVFDKLLHDASTLPNREALINLVDQCLDFSISRMPFSRTLFLEAWTDDEILNKHVWPRLRHVFQMVEGFIAAQMAAKKLRPVDPTLVARFTMGMFFASVMPALRGVEPPPTSEQRRILAETMVALLLDGLSRREEESV